MSFCKTMCMGVAVAAILGSSLVAHAISLEYLDENGNVIPSPPAREDGEIGEKAEGFKLSMKADKQKYAIDEPVNLTVKFSNLDRENAGVSGLSTFEYKLEVLRPDGTLAPLTADANQKKNVAKMFYDGSSGPQSPGTYANGGLRSANLYFEMRRVGEYQIRALKEVPSRDDPKKQVTLISNVIKIRVEAAKK